MYMYATKLRFSMNTKNSNDVWVCFNSLQNIVNDITDVANGMFEGFGQYKIFVICR